LLGVSPGSVTPLAAFNDAENLVRIVIDERLAGEDIVNIHPLRNTATLGMTGNDLVRFLGRIGHDPAIILVPART
jgi:Ala-tRNA(Pro) deacylase